MLENYAMIDFFMNIVKIIINKCRTRWGNWVSLKKPKEGAGLLILQKIKFIYQVDI